MSELNLRGDYSHYQKARNNTSVSVEEFIREIEATPPEYRSNLLQIIRLFRESVTQNDDKLKIDKSPENIVKNAEMPLTQTFREGIDELEQKEVKIYTDGACIGNPGPGGYGVVLLYGKNRKELSGGFQLTTNNRMEMMAAIVGLQVLKSPCNITLYSDSKYVVDAIEKGWAKRWQANNWKRNKKEKASNPDLWEQLLNLCNQHTIKFIWVKGHAGNRENERCDRLAVEASQQRDLPQDFGYIQDVN